MKPMYGAIIGDIVGSTYEFKGIKTKDFELFPYRSKYTDDSIMAIAVAAAVLDHRRDGKDFYLALIRRMKDFGDACPYPMGGYGSRFGQWLRSFDVEPYNSFGNGSAMRVAACGLAATSLEDALALAKTSAKVTHDHPEGIKGAQATAAAIYLARTGSSREAIRDYIRENFYPLDKTLEEIRPDYHFDGSCQGTVPESIQAFLESESYEDAIRNTISLGGDADTMGAITGSIAWAYYGREGLQPDMRKMLRKVRLPEDLQQVVDEFEEFRKTL